MQVRYSPERGPQLASGCPACINWKVQSRKLQTQTSNEEGAMFALVGAFLAQVTHDVLAFIRLPAVLTAFLRSPHTPTSAPSAIMPKAKGSRATDPVGEVQRRQMVHIKTKEECRLGNETVDVWSIELPSKHAESILK